MTLIETCPACNVDFKKDVDTLETNYSNGDMIFRCPSCGGFSKQEYIYIDDLVRQLLILGLINFKTHKLDLKECVKLLLIEIEEAKK